MKPFIEQIFDPWDARFVTDPLGLGIELQLKRNQIPVWLSFFPRNPSQDACTEDVPPENAIFFGALFDTGHNSTLSVTQGVLGLSGAALSQCVDSNNPFQVRASTKQVSTPDRLLGDLWLHSDLPSTEDELKCLRIPLAQHGIACFPNPTGPPIPLLGLGCCARGKMKVVLDYSTADPTTKSPALFQIFVS